MIESILSTAARYFRAVLKGFFSIVSSASATLPHLIGLGELRKRVTEQYPDPVSSRTEDDLPPKTRGFLVNDIDKCTGCGECGKICPVQCIHIETTSGSDLSRAQVAVFDIDFGKCISCGLCVEVCHPASLSHSKKFEGAVYRLPDLVMGFGKGRMSKR